MFWVGFDRGFRICVVGLVVGGVESSVGGGDRGGWGGFFRGWCLSGR